MRAKGNSKNPRKNSLADVKCCKDIWNPVLMNFAKVAVKEDVWEPRTTHLQANCELLGIPQTIANAVKRIFDNIDMIPEFSYLI
jgi:hypothetical protein